MFEIMHSFDRAVVLSLYNVASATMIFSYIVIFVAEWLPPLVIVLAAGYKFFVHENKFVPYSLVRMFAPPLVGVIIAKIFKLNFYSPRPFASDLDISPLLNVSDPFGSFPSAHATFFAALGMTIFMQDPRTGKWFLFVAFLIGLARIAAGVHWPSDIFFGFVLGLSVAMISEISHKIFAQSHKM